MSDEKADAIIAAIERQTAWLQQPEDDPLLEVAKDIRGWIRAIFIVIYISVFVLMLAIAAKASPLLSDGDETASIGTVRTITPHPSWAQPLEGTSWISIAQTGWPLLTWLTNGTVVSFSEMLPLASMPSSATVTYAADDSASLYVNGAPVVAEASTAGNAYIVCSDTAPTCTGHTVADILPWLIVGDNEIRFDVAQRGGWSFGLNYAVGLAWLDEPPLPTPEPNYAVDLLAIALAAFAMFKLGFSKNEKESVPPDMAARLARYGDALRHIAMHSECLDSRCVARKALEE